MAAVKEIKIGDSNYLIEPTLLGTCTTAANTATKDVTLPNFELFDNVQIAVKFTITNTAAVSGLKLRVNSSDDSDAKPIKYRGGNLPAAGTLAQNRIYNFIYDGTNWNVVGDLDTTDYSYKHLTDYNFTTTQPLSKYVTFDKSNPIGAPEEAWYNGFISSHNNYLASYIINKHRTANWYVGYGQYDTSNNTATAPTWYLLAHSGNVTTGDASGQIKIAGVNVTVKDIGASAYHADNYFALASHGNHVPTTQTANNITFLRNDNNWYKLTKTDVSTLINLLDTGSSDLSANDYIVTQYANGGTTTTTYHRRPASAVVNKTLIDAALGTSTTANFYRGDKTWSNTIKQTANAALGVDSSTLKIGTARKDLNFDIGNGSGNGVNDGYAGGITWGNGTSAYAGIYYQSSETYGTRLIFATTKSYGNGSYARMIVQSDGKIGIGTLSPDTLLTVAGAGKFTSTVTLGADPTANMHAATKQYVDGKITALDVTAITGTAAQTITSISETDGKISATFQDISVSHLQAIGDNRETATIPNDYNMLYGKLVFQGLKKKAIIGNPSSDIYSYVIGLRGWSDSTGGDAHELAFNDSGINWRHGATDTWGSWERLATSNEVTQSRVEIIRFVEGGTN